MNMLTLISLEHTLSVTGTVIIGNDWCNTVIKSKYRHKEEALQLKINTKYCSCSNRKLYQDQIHGISHNGADGLHNDGRNTYCINMTDNCFRSGRKPLKLRRTSGLNLWLQTPATMQATNCPITVATAAPVTPIFGAPSRPKIRIGSRIMLVNGTT